MKKTLRFDPKIKRCWVDRTTVGFGVSLYACFSPNYIGPIGFAWGCSARCGRRTRFEVFGSYVMPWARRKGVRTLLNQQILRDHDVVATIHGTKEGGAFMRKFGYTHDPKAMQWTYVKPPKRCRSAP